MRRLLLSLATALWLAPAVSAERPQDFHVTEFGGLNNAVDSYFIPESDAQEAANILTDEGDARTMPGSVESYDLNLSTVQFLGSYIDDSGTKIIIAQSGASVLASQTNGSFSTIQTLSGTHDIDGVKAFKRFYITDGVAPFYYNGSSTSTAAGMEACNYVEFYANRLVCVANSTDTSKVYLSEYNDPADWTVIDTANSPAIKYFHRDDGEAIKCAKTTPYGLFIGKESSCGLLKGSDADTFYWHYLSDDIGCVDDRSVQLVDGVVAWLSKDGVYGYSGSGRAELISKDIRGTTKNIRASGASEQSWLVSTESGWEAGSGAGWDTDYSPGTLKAKLYNSGTMTSGATQYIRMFEGAGFEQGNTTAWTPVFDSTATNYPNYSSGYPAPSGRYLAWDDLGDYLVTPAAASFEVLNAADDALISSTTLSGTGWYTLPAAGSGDIYIRLTNGVGDSHVSPDFDRALGARIFYHRQPIMLVGQHQYDVFDAVELSAPITTAVYGSSDSALTAPVFNLDFKGGNSYLNWQASDDNSTFVSTIIALPGGYVPAAYNKRYYKYSVTMSSGVSISSFTSLAVSVFSTSTYTSPVYNVGDQISAWGNIALAGSGTAFSLETRSSSTAFAADAAAPAWVAQTNNSQVSVSTSAHVQYRIIPSVTSSTESLSFTSLLLGWINGTQAPRVASLVHDGRYLLCTSTESATQNDVCLLWMRNKKWMPITGPSYASLMVHDNTPMAGDGTGGSKVWDILQDDSYTYAGQTIDSYWITKDFAFGKLNHHKVLDRMWISADNSGADFSVAWQKDRDGVWVSSTVTLNDSSFVVKEMEGLFLDNMPLGRQFRFRFSCANADKWFRLKLYSIYFTVNDLIK